MDPVHAIRAAVGTPTLWIAVSIYLASLGYGYGAVRSVSIDRLSFVSLAFVLTMLFAAAVLKQLHSAKADGTILIVLGFLLVARSA